MSDLYKPIFTLTWYPGEWPSTDSPLVLQSASHYADGYAGLAGQVEDIIQVAQFVRGATPDFYNRGSRQTQFEWEEVREYASPSAALADGLDAIAAMPSESGWLSIAIPDEDRAWAVQPCMIKSSAFPKVEKAGTKHLVRLQWSLLCGVTSEIAVEVPEEDYLLTETGFTFLCEDGSEIALESYT